MEGVGETKLTVSLGASHYVLSGFHFIYMESVGATLLVGTWEREKQE